MNMKKAVLIWLLFILLPSCTEELGNILSSEENTSIKAEEFKNLASLSSSTPIVSEPITLYRYTSAVVRPGLANQVLDVTEEMGEAMDMPPGRYVVDYYRVKMDVTLPQSMYGLKQFSPDCGYDPFIGNGVKGYSPLQTGRVYSMQTNTTHFKSLNGVIQNGIWRPHDPEFMKWVYAQRNTLNIIERTDVASTNKHVAFTTLAGNSTRSKILIAYREGTGHLTLDGQIIQMASYDYGKTWTERKIIYKSASKDVRDPQFLVLSDNILICRFFEGKQGAFTVKCMISEDFGNTYKSPVTIPTISSAITAGARGNMLFLNNNIYSVSYDSKDAWLVKSTNSGTTWSVVSKLREGTGMSETSLGYENGKMFCIARQDYVHTLAYGVSNDMGKTWIWQDLDIYGEAPSLTHYNDGYILTYRDRSDLSIILAFWKNGKVNSPSICIYSAKGKNNSWDIGYGDVLTIDNSFLVSCYTAADMPTNSLIRCYEFLYDVFK